MENIADIADVRSGLLEEAPAESMLAEWRERVEDKLSPSPLDRANAAFERAIQAGEILSEDFDPASLRVCIERVGKLARLTAQAVARDQDTLAELFAAEAEAGALVLDQFDTARFDGLSRPEPLGDGRAGRHIANRRK